MSDRSKSLAGKLIEAIQERHNPAVGVREDGSRYLIPELSKNGDYFNEDGDRLGYGNGWEREHDGERALADSGDSANASDRGKGSDVEKFKEKLDGAGREVSAKEDQTRDNTSDNSLGASLSDNKGDGREL